MPTELEQLSFANKDAWARWLAKHHADSPGIWMRVAKKGAGEKTVSYAEAVEVALCWGWIDGQAKSVDDACYLQRFTPRRAKSIWSKINREKAERLIASKQMRPPGLAAVRAAQADGRWDAAYDSPSSATIPDDLRAALDGDAAARAFFEGLDSTNRFAILHRLQAAKKPETRARRLEQFVEMLRKRETLHPVKSKRTTGQRGEAAVQRYAAFLRGVSPMNCKMPELKRSFEAAGFTAVRTVISSGNVVFDAPAKSEDELAEQAEAAMSRSMGRSFPVIVRKVDALAALLVSDPFEGAELGPDGKRVVTFLKRPPKKRPSFPIELDGARIIGMRGCAIFTSYVPHQKGPVFMNLIEKTFGKEITTRTWGTIEKVARS